jgi:hypothetical protein
MNQCVGQKMLVVTVRKVGSLVRATGFFPAQGGFDDRLDNVEHPGQLEKRREFSIERAAVIVDAGPREALLQQLDLVDRRGQGWSVTVDSGGGL